MLKTKIIPLSIISMLYSYAYGSCVNVNDRFQESIKTAYQCTDGKLKDYFDMTTSPSDLATAISYECSKEIKKLAENQYEVAICSVESKSKESLLAEQKKHPAVTTIPSLESDINGIMIRKYTSDIIRIRANINKKARDNGY